MFIHHLNRISFSLICLRTASLREWKFVEMTQVGAWGLEELETGDGVRWVRMERIKKKLRALQRV